MDTDPPHASDRVLRGPQRRVGQHLDCGWCGASITVKTRGRTPKWCSSSCRHRAWEQSRAQASEDRPVRVVDRTIDRVTVIERTLEHPVEVEVQPRYRGARWVDPLTTLTRHLDTGLLYDRDLRAVATALADLNVAMDRRLSYSKKW